MPLRKGTSRAIISQNIREMRAAGHPEAQSVAAALSTADRSRKGKPMARRKHEEHKHRTHAKPFGHEEGMGGEKGVSPRKAMAMGSHGGNFGVEPFHEAQGHAGIHPDHREHTGAKPHLEDHERGAGPGIHHTHGHHPAQAAPDHGPHHVEGYNQHEYEGAV